ncbi:hypothetical protein R3P38DRAFT_3593762 [Favolaschia claudopus]|uniref:Carboxylesterase type B domain-containing protein n=1 Tax=Favolaschia claudopus TaxID=2862362 RepID=A0AAW0DJJ9_9AGAR
MPWPHKFVVLMMAASTVFAGGISTSSGEIIGHPASTRPAVMEYLGIPFARPPIDDLRFAPPEPFDGQGIIKATDFSVTP